MPALSYPDSRFPDAASALVDAERKTQFEEEGAHYESRYFLTLLFLPPAPTTMKRTFTSKSQSRRQLSTGRVAIGLS